MLVYIKDNNQFKILTPTDDCNDYDARYGSWLVFRHVIIYE